MSQKPSWERRVAEGDFGAVPSPFLYQDSVVLAHLLDGYRFAGGLQELANLADAKGQEYRETRVWNGTALELWAVLFFRHRASRHGGTDEEDREDPDNDALCEALRVRLVSMNKAESDAVLAALIREGACSEDA